VYIDYVVRVYIEAAKRAVTAHIAPNWVVSNFPLVDLG
jgi:hypothetical protein